MSISRHSTMSDYLVCQGPCSQVTMSINRHSHLSDYRNSAPLCQTVSLYFKRIGGGSPHRILGVDFKWW